MIRILSKDAPVMSILKLTNCAAPANTNADMPTACMTLRPALIAAEPANIPHGITATESGNISCTPRKKLKLFCWINYDCTADSIFQFARVNMRHTLDGFLV